MVPEQFVLSPEVATAFRLHQPIVALESAVITHGLPRPHNLLLAAQLEEVVRAEGAVPATIALLDGKVHIGLSPAELERLANEPVTRKISRRDFGLAITRLECGGTTVAGTLVAAHAVGIRVFATGGIGGVHRDAPFDVSADLAELGRSPLVVVCAGAKSILDLPATLEVLETNGVPVIGYQTLKFPAFFAVDSGLSLQASAQSPQEIAQIAESQWKFGIEAAVLVANPPPAEIAMPSAEVEKAIVQALDEAKEQHIHGAAMTPFLLDRVNHLTGGTSLKTNLALLRSNARLAAQIAIELSRKAITEG